MPAPVIGMIGPVAGPEGVVMGPMVTAARSALADAIAAGRADPAMRLRVLDDDRDPDRARRHVTALAADPAVVGVVGPKNSGSALACRDLADGTGLPLLLPAATAVALDGPGPVLRLCATDADVAATATDVLLLLGPGPVRVEADDTPYGRGLAAAVTAALAARGVDPDAGPPVDGTVFLAMGEVEQAERMRVLRAAGSTAAFVGAEGGPGAPLAALAGTAGEGAWQCYPGADAPGAVAVYTAEVADAVDALVDAAAGDGDRAAVLARLRAGSGRPGRTGPVRFGPDGRREGARVSLWRLRDGRSVPAEAPD